MDLEELLIKDRIAFESKVAAKTDPSEQSLAGGRLFNCFIDDMIGSKESFIHVIPRVDAFMLNCVKHKVAEPLVMFVLRSTISAEKQYANRQALVEYYRSIKAPEPLTSLAVLKELPNASEYTTRRENLLARKANGFNVAELIQLKKLCHEYQDWLESVNNERAFMNPKNYPTRDQLRVRDNILESIREVATPDLLLKLVAQVLRTELLKTEDSAE